MDWQQVASLTIVGVTAGMMIRSTIVRRTKGISSVCSSGCHCPAKTVHAGAADRNLRRPGERAEGRNFHEVDSTSR
jgi:hypothetical protein